jgi:hypothetical protein
MIPSTTRTASHPAASTANSAASSGKAVRAPHHLKSKDGTSGPAQLAQSQSIKEAPIPGTFAATATARTAPMAPSQAAAPVSSVAAVAPGAAAASASAAAMYAPSESAVVDIGTYQGLLGIAARYDVTNISPKQMASLGQDLYHSGAISMQDAALLSFQPPQAGVVGPNPSPDTDVDYYARWEKQLTTDAKSGDASAVSSDQRMLNILGNLVALRESVIGAAVGSASLASASGPAAAPAAAPMPPVASPQGTAVVAAATGSVASAKPPVLHSATAPSVPITSAAGKSVATERREPSSREAGPNSTHATMTHAAGNGAPTRVTLPKASA